jgi:hypothetical protein
MPVVGKPVWNMKFPFAKPGADRREAGSTGLRSLFFSGERFGFNGEVLTEPDAAKAVVTNPCSNNSLINVNIKIKRIASDSFK